MKNLKKHPKQQRMEDMKIPGSNKRPKQTATQLVDSYDFTTPVWIESIKEAKRFDKVTMTGREWLRSINDDNGFTLMPRIVWRVVAVGVLVGAVIYFLSTR